MPPVSAISALSLFVGEGEGIAFVGEEFLRVLRHKAGMHGDHGNVARVGVVQRVEAGQLMDARRAAGRPEVDEGDLAPLLRQVESASIIADCGEVRKLLADLMAHGVVGLQYILEKR